jgi:hypothetical protein
MFWTLLFPEALMFHVTAYEPSMGYSIPWRRVVFSTPSVIRLWRISQAPRFQEDPLLCARLHAGLMSLLEQAMDEPDLVKRRADDVRQRIIERIMMMGMRSGSRWASMRANRPLNIKCRG